MEHEKDCDWNRGEGDGDGQGDGDGDAIERNGIELKENASGRIKRTQIYS